MLKFDDLSNSIERIVEIVARVPEPFKDRCFQTLLDAAVAEASEAAPETSNHKGTSDADCAETRIESQHDQPRSKGRYAQFLAERSISQANIARIVGLEGEEVVFYRHPKAEKKATAQIHWALLLALINGMKTGALTVSGDAVREKVKEEKIYDESNFAKTFTSNRSLFVGSMGKGDPERRLSSPAGEEELAKLISSLGGA